MKKSNFWENFIFYTIILVIFQIFFEDFTKYRLTPLFYRKLLLFTGLIFDLIFTIEFFVRSYLAYKNKKLFLYWFYQRGWVDFLSSIPLLLFNSLPSIILFFKSAQSFKSGIGILNILKIVKAIRITRILRLIRIMKIFGKIHNTESVMANRHISVISTTVTFTIIIVMLCYLFIFGNIFDRAINERNLEFKNLLEAVMEINRDLDVPLKSISFKLFYASPNILRAYYEDLIIISKVNDEIFRKYYGFEDYIIVKKYNFALYVSIVDINKSMAFLNLLIFFIINFVIFSIMTIYSRYFVQNISDIIHIIYRGLTEKDYKLEVRIREEFKDDEIFKLASYYNDVYLSEKIRREQEEREKKYTPLTLDDILKFKK